MRAVWASVDSLDLAALYAKIRAVEGGVGRDAVDPKILLALWIFATIEAVSSARHLTRLCTRDVVYEWLCGGVGVNYHLVLCHSLIFGLDISRNALASGSTGASALRLIGLTRILGCDREMIR